MDMREALHAAARRECMDKHAHWAEVYRQLQAGGRASKQLDELTWGYTEEAYSTFPRYLVWWAILQEIERLETRSADSTEALREQLANAALRADTPLTTNPGLPSAAQAAMAEEREKFIHFVRSVPERRLELVESLELRRVFGKDELCRLWVNLDARWDVKLHHYWWPMREGVPPPNVVAFHTDWFDHGKTAALRGILVDHGIHRVCELREFGEWGCELAAEALEPAYNGEEGYWTSPSFDWLVYASHESSITIAGDWLVWDFRRQFPDADRLTYGGPFSTQDQRGSWKP
jgi:hypothetical protein